MNIRSIVVLCDEYSADFGPLSLPHSRFLISPTGSQESVEACIGWRLNPSKWPEADGWLSPISGIGKVRHLSVRAALAIDSGHLSQSPLIGFTSGSVNIPIELESEHACVG